MKRIISDFESLQILRNDLAREARQKYAAQLESADSAERQKIMGQIETDVEEELRRRQVGRGRKWMGLTGVFREGDGLIH